MLQHFRASSQFISDYCCSILNLASKVACCLSFSVYGKNIFLFCQHIEHHSHTYLIFLYKLFQRSLLYYYTNKKTYFVSKYYHIKHTSFILFRLFKKVRKRRVSSIDPYGIPHLVVSREVFSSPQETNYFQLIK